MSDIRQDLKYTEEHEWVKAEDGIAVVGNGDFAQEELGDIVHIDFSDIDLEAEQVFKQGERFGSVEAVKTVSDLYMPLSGVVVEINEDLEDEAEKVNESPYEDGWMVKIKLSDPGELDSLMDADAYKQFIEQE